MKAQLEQFFKNIKAEFKAAFDLPPAVITPAAPVAPAVLAAPSAPVPNTLADGTPILITQAGDVPAAGDTVTAADGSPLPAGDITLVDGTTLSIDDGGVIITVGAAAPVTTDLAGAPPVPTLEERIGAIEAIIAKATQPAAMSAEDAETIKKLKEDNATLVKTVGGLFELIEKIGGEPTAEPVTVPDAKKAKFERAKQKEDKILGYAQAITQINKSK